MSLNVITGLQAAKTRAASLNKTVTIADRLFNSYLQPYLGSVSLGLAVGHLLTVNPQLSVTPEVTKDRRRGFMKTTALQASKLGLTWESLDTPDTCGYVWGCDINNTALNLYTTNQALFSEPDHTFWMSAYCNYLLGDATFKLIWDLRDTQKYDIYTSLLYAVNDLKRSLPGWPVLRLKKTVLVDCECVRLIALKYGKLSSDNYGIQPVVNRTKIHGLTQ